MTLFVFFDFFQKKVFNKEWFIKLISFNSRKLAYVQNVTVFFNASLRCITI